MPNGATWTLSSYTTTNEQVDNVICNGTEPKLSDCSFNVISAEPNIAVRVDCINNDCSTGDIRLVGGETEAVGRVEMCNNYKWGTVCDDNWTERHTSVVCRHLGFSDITGDSSYFTSEMFGRGTGPILIDYISCSGSEPNLRICTHFTHSYGCSHNDDVGVHCHPASCSNGQLRLIYKYHGRIEICSNQRWESLNNYYWTPSTASVACVELGFATYNSWNSNYGRGGGPIHQKYYYCVGNEKRLSKCNSYIDTTLRSHNQDVGIYCFQAGCVDWEMRLIEGETEWEGRLEICYSKRWGTVGSGRWSQVNSQVVCNALGYDSTEESKADRNIPQSLSKPVHFHNIVCQITALTLKHCSYTRYASSGNNVTDVIISCQKSSCSDGDLKLVGGSVTSEGRLQICFNNMWTTINAEGWTHHDTQVACTQLEYSTSDFRHYTIDRSLVSLPAIISHVSCYGTEERLIDCYYSETSSATSDYDIGIICGTITPTTMTPNSTNSTSPMNSTTTPCYTCTISGDDDSGSKILIASLTSVLCFSAVIGLAAGCLIVVFIKKRKRHVKGSNTSINDSGKDDKISENISYIPSIGHKKSSEGGGALYYDSIKDEPSSSCQQPLPPIPMTPVTKDHGTVDHIIYETCQ